MNPKTLGQIGSLQKRTEFLNSKKINFFCCVTASLFTYSRVKI